MISVVGGGYSKRKARLLVAEEEERRVAGERDPRGEGKTPAAWGKGSTKV